MRVNLSIEEIAAVRNALATRHDDLRDLITQWSSDEQMANSAQLVDAEREMAVVLDLGAKLAQ